MIKILNLDGQQIFKSIYISIYSEIIILAFNLYKIILWQLVAI